MDQLDHLIDQAAREMVHRHPSDALTRAVMERVVSGRRPSRTGGLVWGSAAVATAAAMAMFLFMQEPPVGQLAPRTKPASAAASVSVEPRENREAEMTVARRHPDRMPPTISEDERALSDLADVEPIDLPPVSLQAIGVEVTSEEPLAPPGPLTIEPIQIESPSND
jgi:hypothetical protein